MLFRSTHSRPAVYNERSIGTSTGDFGAISGLKNAHEAQDSWTQQLTGDQVSDVHQHAITQLNTSSTDLSLCTGRVLFALPYIHCYRVQLFAREGTCIAIAATPTSLTPLGVRSGEVIAPNSVVVIWKPRASLLAYILGVLPTPSLDDKFNASDYLQQGGNSGPKRVEAYRNITRTAAESHGWVPQSCGRPIDGTIGEYVRMSETGIGLLIDSFQTYLRVNEACGLWLNYFDSYTKLAGLSLNIMSYCEHNFQQYDEGELFSLKGYATYPWEATGMYAPGTSFIKSNPEELVQLDKQFPFADKEVTHQEQTPIYRMTDYTGYLGQGFNRTLIRPAVESGTRRVDTATTERDIGLFQELLALDGSYSVRSAKQITFAKYPVIPSPRRLRKVEDALGDDYVKDNDYKFSGEFGGGVPHTVKEWDASGIRHVPNMLRPAGIMDMMVRHYNWKSTHPFFYHKKDYDYPEEGENAGPLKSVEFIRGSMTESYVEARPVTLKIDKRYGDVNYYRTASFFTLAEDGSVVIGDGYGSQIFMGGGQIRLEASGDLMLMAGARVVTLAQESITRAKGSVDISSSNADVRIKAEKNMQLLAGNSGTGGMLLESKGTGATQAYAKLIGEEVVASGIVLLSRGGVINAVAKSMYFRTGVDPGNAESFGDFTVDCANGRSNMVAYAKSHNFFNSDGLGIWHAPRGKDVSAMTASHFFGPNFSKIHGPTAMDDTVGISGELGVDGGVYAKGLIGAVGGMTCKGGAVSDSSAEGGKFAQSLDKFLTDFATASKDQTAAGLPEFNASYKSVFWQPNQMGNSTFLIEEIGFSFRDLTSKQPDVYGYTKDKFFLLETRWQQLDRKRLGGGSGGGWAEKEVKYQGNELYPWPGKANWIERQAFLGYREESGFLLFDAADDRAKPRKDNQTDYEQPRFTAWKETNCQENYKF